MTKLLLVTLLMLSHSSYAKTCLYHTKASDIKLTWTAFKTPLKAGVSGTFKDLGVTKNLSGKQLHELLVGTKFKIKTGSVSTNNAPRDLKIATFFFAPSGPTITGKVLKYSKKILKVAITMNHVTKIVPLKLNIKGPIIEATGIIDVLDFNMGHSLTALNNACKELHEGKTWSDVSLKLEVSYSQNCK